MIGHCLSSNNEIYYNNFSSTFRELNGALVVIPAKAELPCIRWCFVDPSPILEERIFIAKKRRTHLWCKKQKKNANRVMSASGPSEEEQPLQRSRTIRSKRLIALGTVRLRSSLPGQILPNSDRNSQFPIPKWPNRSW